MSDTISTKHVAQGRWQEILLALGVAGKLLNKREQPCPFCGGKDRFQWKDYDGTGGFICRQCGNGNGFEFLKRLFGWSFKEAANRIDGILAHNWRISMSPESRPPISMEIQIPKSVRDCAVWLKKSHPDQLETWLNKHDIEVRWWLQSQGTP